MAIAFDSASTRASNSSAKLSWVHTTSGSDRYIKLNVTGRTVAGGVSSVSYGATGMTQVGSTQSFSATFHKAFELVNPPLGATTITVNCTGSLRLSAAAASYTGVDQAAPSSGLTQVIGTSGGVKVTVASTAGELVVDCASMEAGTGGGTLTVDGTGEVDRGNVTTTSGSVEEVTAEGDVAGAASSTVSWVRGGVTGNWGIYAWSLAPAVAGGIASGAGNNIRRRLAA